MRLVSSSRMKIIDKLASERFLIPSLILMENAGRSGADVAEKMLNKESSHIAIFCGYGNNGGDGFVIARHLINRGYSVVIYLVGRQKKMSDDTGINFNILRKMKVRFEKLTNDGQIDAVIRKAKRAQLIIDAIFGMGIKGALDKFYIHLFERLNSANVAILSIDIPSGIDADKGVALPIAIKAKKTVTMGLAKKGFLNPIAKKYLGKVIIGDISLPKQLRK